MPNAFASWETVFEREFVLTIGWRCSQSTIQEQASSGSGTSMLIDPVYRLRLKASQNVRPVDGVGAIAGIGLAAPVNAFDGGMDVVTH
jgi:hypothetical protein